MFLDDDKALNDYDDGSTTLNFLKATAVYNKNWRIAQP